MSTAYSLLPIELVMQLVADLHNTRSVLYHTIVSTESQKKLYTIWKIQDGHADYLISESPYAPTSQTILTASDFRFFGVNFDQDGTLLQCMLMNNVVNSLINTVRTFVTLLFRGEEYNLTFDVYQNGNIVEQKESLCHLFCFPSFTFIYYGTIVLQYTWIDQFPIITYIGKLDHERKQIQSYFSYDYANGNLMGILQSQLVFFWNDKSFALMNSFPDLSSVVYTSQGPIPRSLSVLIGGQNVFSFETRRPSSELPPDEKWNILRLCTAAYNYSYFANEPTGGKLQFTSLKEFILLRPPPRPVPTSSASLQYLIAFTSLKSLTTFPYYAIIGESQFTDTQTKIRTYPIPLEFRATYDPETWQNYETIWFLYTGTTILMYEEGFSRWRTLNAGNINVNDLRVSLLAPTNSVLSFDSYENKTLSTAKVMESSPPFELPALPDSMSGGKSVLSSVTSSGVSSR